MINSIENLRFCPKEEIFNFPLDTSKIRLGECGCFNEKIWIKVLENIDANKELTILEMGSWYGYGACSTANFLKNNGLKFKILCADTWLGSPEHLYNNHSFLELKLKNGYPQFYFDFLNVVKYFHCEDDIIPFPNTTSAAVNISQKMGIEYDIIIIDGSHQYEDVKNDIELSWRICRRDGLILGDDLQWQDVRKALDEFCHLKGKTYLDLYYQFILLKNEA